MNALQGYNPQCKTLQEAVLNNEVKAFSKLITKITAPLAIYSEDRMQLSKLKKNDEQICTDLVEFVLDWGANLMGKMDNYAQMLVPALANEIIEKYWYFSFDEVCYVIKKGVFGDYKLEKQFTNPFDVASVLHWFECYDCGERIDFISQKEIKKNEEYKKQNVLLINQKDSKEIFEIYNSSKYEKKSEPKTKNERFENNEEYSKFKADLLAKKQKI